MRSQMSTFLNTVKGYTAVIYSLFVLIWESLWLLPDVHVIDRNFFLALGVLSIFCFVMALL